MRSRQLPSALGLTASRARWNPASAPTPARLLPSQLATMPRQFGQTSSPATPAPPPSSFRIAPSTPDSHTTSGPTPAAYRGQSGSSFGAMTESPAAPKQKQARVLNLTGNRSGIPEHQPSSLLLLLVVIEHGTVSGPSHGWSLGLLSNSSKRIAPSSWSPRGRPGDADFR